MEQQQQQQQQQQQKNMILLEVILAAVMMERLGDTMVMVMVMVMIMVDWDEILITVDKKQLRRNGHLGQKIRNACNKIYAKTGNIEHFPPHHRHFSQYVK